MNSSDVNSFYRRPELFWVRYSDHSSTSELIAFLKRLTFKRLTPIAKEIAPERITELLLLSAKVVVDGDSDGDSTRFVCIELKLDRFRKLCSTSDSFVSLNKCDAKLLSRVLNYS